MNQVELLRVLRKQPFEPFRLCLSDGTTYDIRHPDQCSVGRTTAHVGVPKRAGTETFQDIVLCALLHITHIEPLMDSART
jgi:hypothetical protein